MQKKIDLSNKRIVCLGGGIGTCTLIKGLKNYNPQLTVITSMADDGGSSGRLRKAYKIMPPGDMISCIAALIEDNNRELADLLTYRIPGNSKSNKSIDGQKFGNLIILTEFLRTNNIYKALEVTKKMFGVNADILPATDERVRQSAITVDGRRIHSETALDLGKYAQPNGIKKTYITPKNPVVNNKVIDSLQKADVIISGPGDLYTNQLPVMVVPKIREQLLKAKCKKIFVLNIANKPCETEKYNLKSFINAIKVHLGEFPFDTVIVNNNTKNKIPNKYNKYQYIKFDNIISSDDKINIVEDDLINDDLPIYHDSKKLSQKVAENI